MCNLFSSRVYTGSEEQIKNLKVADRKSKVNRKSIKEHNNAT